ncbi:pectin acetylesterase-family hydrolase [Chondromyces crocatus]|uniref:Pectinacetylesterase n=1 Tax=Chondromyces crocatus TaxID=52 RepID=A0A0K1EGS4_CHOCO|nr:pectin acetylesterase-family hydrolase [Chondromyces crocatus]AKT39798.1 pectinacetylesterase [Chondromyces crocatus]
MLNRSACLSRPLRAVFASSVAIVALAACSGSDAGKGSSGEPPEEGAGGSPAELPHFDALPVGTTSVLRPGGETTCSRGGEFAFIVRPGDPTKVIVEFEGGGACWNEQTCSFAGAIFKETVDTERYTASPPGGWYDQSREGHPMKGWTHVYIPYCTGDIHWGDNVQTYGQGEKAVTIRHKGAVNVRAALDWVYRELRAPEKIFVTGCSAGGYGSIWWAPELQRHYGASRVYHFSDSAAGVITSDFFEKSFPSWNAQASFPSFVGDFREATSLSALYRMIAAHYPENVYSQFNTLHDDNQTFYFTAMGGGGTDAWTAQMLASVASIEAAAPKFGAFIAGGEQHCILPYENFYTAEAGGTKLTTWLADMVNDRPVESVFCEDCSP